MMSNELLVIIIPGIIGLIIFLTRSREGRKQVLFDDTVKRNQQLFDAALLTVADLTTKTIAMSVENARLTTLDTVSQRDIAGLQRQITKQDERFTEQASQLTSLRTSSDIERSQFNQRSIDYQKRIDDDALTISTLKQTVERLEENSVTQNKKVEAQDKKIEGLEARIETLIKQRDKLQDDKTERVRQSAHGADNATLERMMSDAKAEMIQESDSDDESP